MKILAITAALGTAPGPGSVKRALILTSRTLFCSLLNLVQELVEGEVKIKKLVTPFKKTQKPVSGRFSSNRQYLCCGSSLTVVYFIGIPR